MKIDLKVPNAVTRAARALKKNDYTTYQNQCHAFMLDDSFNSETKMKFMCYLLLSAALREASVGSLGNNRYLSLIKSYPSLDQLFTDESKQRFNFESIPIRKIYFLACQENHAINTLWSDVQAKNLNTLMPKVSFNEFLESNVNYFYNAQKNLLNQSFSNKNLTPQAYNQKNVALIKAVFNQLDRHYHQQITPEERNDFGKMGLRVGRKIANTNGIFKLSKFFNTLKVDASHQLEEIKFNYLLNPHGNYSKNQLRHREIIDLFQDANFSNHTLEKNLYSVSSILFDIKPLFDIYLDKINWGKKESKSTIKVRSDENFEKLITHMHQKAIDISLVWCPEKQLKRIDCESVCEDWETRLDVLRESQLLDKNIANIVSMDDKSKVKNKI